jgi:hypothetical protein
MGAEPKYPVAAGMSAFRIDLTKTCAGFDRRC